MTAYLVVDIAIHDEEGHRQYPPAVHPLVAKHGGKLMAKLSDLETIEGSWSPSQLIIIEFPDKAAVRNFYDDPEYAPVRGIRHNTAESQMVVGSSE